MRLLWVLFLAGLACAPGCRKDAAPAKPAVYHWESAFDLTPQERQWLNDLGAQRIYLRLFDIDREGGGEPVPLGVLDVPPGLDTIRQEVVPCFFLTNRTFENLSEIQSDTLAARLIRKARMKLREQLGHPLVKEWQFDCDWTEGTREAYFRFLERIASGLEQDGVRLSATIRLHQVKYFKRTGVPPVSRGMLMFYNMGDVTDPQTANSILDLNTARGYYQNFSAYPLPLDLALPLFRWGVVVREGKMVRLINDLEEADLLDSSRFYFRDATHARVRKSTYLDGYYLYRDDEIRLESVAMASLAEAAKDLARIMARRPEWISFYQISPATVKRYSHEELETICEILEQ